VTLEEWHAVLTSEPATPNQVGAIHGEARRLNLTDRAERLAASAALLDLDQLGSTRDLTMGQADCLLRTLQDCRDRAALDAMIPARPQPEPAARRVTWADVIAAIARELHYATVNPTTR